MFYCDDCAAKKGWPISFTQSHGKCEICGAIRICNDTPSSELPKKEHVKSSGFVLHGSWHKRAEDYGSLVHSEDAYVKGVEEHAAKALKKLRNRLADKRDATSAEVPGLLAAIDILENLKY